MSAFYWRLVFPSLLLVLLIQLGVAFVAPDLVGLSASQATAEGYHLSKVNHHHVNSSSFDTDSMLTDNSKSFKSYENDAIGDVVEGAKSNVENVLVQLKEWISMEDFPSLKEQALLLITNSSIMLKCIAISYILAVVQLALVYLLSSNVIIAWYTNIALEKASDDVSQILRAHGVSHVLTDVLGTRMVRVRQKVLKLIAFSKELDEILEKINGNAQTTGTRLLFSRFGFGRKT